MMPKLSGLDEMYFADFDGLVHSVRVFHTTDKQGSFACPNNPKEYICTVGRERLHDTMLSALAFVAAEQAQKASEAMLRQAAALAEMNKLIQPDRPSAPEQQG